MHLYFSDIFDVSPKALDKYGAFNISLITDLPLFKKDFCPGKSPEDIAFLEWKKEFQMKGAFPPAPSDKMV